jgi:hypothetical protein
VGEDRKGKRIFPGRRKAVAPLRPFLLFAGSCAPPPLHRAVKRHFFLEATQAFNSAVARFQCTVKLR